jgi:hypothetical protein
VTGATSGGQPPCFLLANGGLLLSSRNAPFYKRRMECSTPERIDRRWTRADRQRRSLPVCSILLGFLFAGFWGTLNRELSFKAEDRHFKRG